MKPVQQVRRPLVGVALCWVFGIYLGQLFDGLSLLFLGCGALALSAVCWGRRPMWLLALACLFVGAAHSGIEKLAAAPGNALLLAGSATSSLEVEGTVTSDVSRDGKSFLLESEAVRVQKDWHRGTALLRVYIRSSEPDVQCGERLVIRGRYHPYGSPRSGVSGSLLAYREGIRRFGMNGRMLQRACYAARSRIAGVLMRGRLQDTEHGQLLLALLLGYRDQIPDDLYYLFSRTGSLHVFAISGLHVGVMASILIAVLKGLGVSRQRWGLWLIPLLFLYVFSTGMKASAFRAFTMAAVYFMAPLFGRRPDVVSAIALAAVFLLALDPLQLSNPGFLLSFTVVSGIVMVHRETSRRMHGLTRKGWAFALRENDSRSGTALLHAVQLLAITSVAAWIFSAPLTARYFHTLSPAALMANLAIIPLTYMIVLTGCLTVLASGISVSAASLAGHANHLFLSGLIGGLRAVDPLPGAHLFVCAPPVGSLLMWYTGLVLLFTGTARLRRFSAVCLAGALLLWGLPFTSPRYGMDVLREGDAATLLRTAPGQWVLLSDGSTSGSRRTIRRLQLEGINRLEALIVTGVDVDATSVVRLVDTFSPKTVWMPPEAADSGSADAVMARGVPVTFARTPEWPAGQGTVCVSGGVY